jgi:lysine-N-methylase
VTDAAKELAQLAALLERHVGKSADAAPPPAMPAGQQVSWPDACRMVQVLVEIVEDRSDRLERRLRTCLAVARVGARTEWSNLKGARVTRYRQAVRTAMEAETPRDFADPRPPEGLVGGVMFRTLLAVFASRERDARRATRVRSRLGRMRAGWRFARGRGHVPRVNEFLPETTFEQIEARTGQPPEIDETLERYYVVKLNSLQFCGPSNFDLPFWAGLESLVLTLPMILWLRRAFDDKAPVAAAQQAIQIVDDHFGGDPMLGFSHIQYLQRTLVQSGELEKLIAWYGR